MKRFGCMNLSNPHNDLEIGPFITLTLEEETGSERLNDLPKVTQHPYHYEEPGLTIITTGPFFPQFSPFPSALVGGLPLSPLPSPPHRCWGGLGPS